MGAARKQWVRADSPEAMAYTGEIYGRVRASAIAQADKHRYEDEEYEEEYEHRSIWPTAIAFCVVFSVLMWAGVVFGDGDGQWGANQVRQTIVPLPGFPSPDQHHHQPPAEPRGYQGLGY